MWIAYFAIAYAIFAGLFLFLVICGQNPAFAGSIVEKAAVFVTGGCCDVLLAGVETICGRQAARGAEAYLESLCFSRNPFLAGIYLVMVAAVYYLYNARVFGILPTTVTPLWHKYTGTLSTALCIFFWIVVCCSDPGKVTSNNHSEWLARDGSGDRLYAAGECRTCKYTKPARSKHCPACNVCVARHDHHCGWVNNCIGAANLRWFLAFLLSNVVMMWYGSALAAAAVWGRLADIGFLHRPYKMPHSGEVIVLKYRPWYTFKLGLRIYPTAVALSIFLLLSGLVLFGFFTFHAWSASIGLTKHDRLKRSRANQALREQNQQQEGQSPSMVPLKVSYSRGFWRNWLEVLLPSSIRPAEGLLSASNMGTPANKDK
eukprot:jgi/Ulvmu1/6349/UM029_0057.1